MDSVSSTSLLERGSAAPDTLGGEDLIRVVLGMESAIVSKGIQSGAQWEVWLQVELMAALRERYGVNGREWYLPGERKSVDIAFTYNGRYYFVELKVESANNAGQFAGTTCQKAVAADIEKLERISLEGTEGSIALRVVLVVGWSPSGKKSYEKAMADYDFHLYVPSKSIFVAVFFADSGR